jgi:hypothetical protein
MFVYNITNKVNHDILDEWIRWQKEVQIPEIMLTGVFTGHKFYKLLDQDDSDGTTYVIQYLCESKEHYNRYLTEFAPGLSEKYGELAL